MLKLTMTGCMPMAECRRFNMAAGEEELESEPEGSENEMEGD